MACIFNYLTIAKFSILVGDGRCTNRHVKINKDGFPFVFLNEEWIPYCGKYFLNNKNAMTEFCQKMNHTTGRLIDQKNTKAIGRCYNGDGLEKTGIQIAFKCEGGNLDRTISCKGENGQPSPNTFISQ